MIACFEDMLAVGSGLLCCGQGRDLVYMSAYSGSLPCLDYLLGALGEHECINRAYKVPSQALPAHARTLGLTQALHAFLVAQRGVRLGHAAAMRGHLHVLQHLTSRGYDLHAVDDYVSEGPGPA